MLSFFSGLILKIAGWKLIGAIPHQIPKYVMIPIPHTSYWDFPLGIFAKSALKLDLKFAAKDSVFRPPFAWFFRWLGGVPVDRSKSNNFVEGVIDIFNREEKFGLVVAPEGTRAKVEKLKTGFYYIAKGAEVPIIMVRFNFEKKEMEFRAPYYLTDNMEADFEVIDNYFRYIKGKRPELGYLWEGNNEK